MLPEETWKVRLAEAREYVNGSLRRETLGGLTAAEYSRTLEPWYHSVDRDRFYEATCTAVREALAGVEDARLRALKEREAKLRTMEQFGLIERTRGDAPHPHLKCERIS